MRTIKKILKEFINFYGSFNEDYRNINLEDPIQSAIVYSKLLEKVYDPKKGGFWFKKFIVGDMKETGSGGIRWNNLFNKWDGIQQKHPKKHLLFLCSRSHGKTTKFSILDSIYQGYINKNFQQVIISAGAPQANLIVRDIRTVIENNELLIKLADFKRWSTEFLSFNGGFIIARGIGAEIRGLHPHRVVLDDILRSDEKISHAKIESFVFEDIIPAIAPKKGKLVIVGTKKDATDIFTIIQMMIKEGADKWKIFKFPGILDAEKKKVLAEDIHSWEDLMDMKKTMGSIKFEKEIMCLKGDTPISTKTGWKQIKDIKIGNKILTHKNRYKKVKNTFKRKIKENIIKIKTYYCTNPLTLTQNHPIFVKRNDKLSFIKAEDVKITDMFIYPIKKRYEKDINEIEIENFLKNSYLFYLKNNEKYLFPKLRNTIFTKNDYEQVIKTDNFYNLTKILKNKLKFQYRFKRIKNNILNNGKTRYSIKNKLKIDKNFLKLCGLYLAEGCVSGNNISFSFNKNEKKLIKLTIYLIEKILQRKPTLHIHNNCCQIFICHKLFGEFLKSEFGKGSLNKKIPEWIYNLPFNKTNILIKHYLFGDGHIKNKNQVRVSSVSNTLILQIRELLLNQEIIGRINYDKEKENTIIEGRKVNCNNFSSLDYCGINGWKLKKLLFKTKTTMPTQLKNNAYIKNNYLFTNIKEIKKEFYDDYVFNFESEKDNSYTTLNTSLHNCEAIGAGMRIFDEKLLELAKDRSISYENVPEKNAPYYAGADLARSGSASADFTAGVFLKYNERCQYNVIVDIYHKKGIKIKHQVKGIAIKCEKFNNAMLLVEKNNFGQDFVDEMIDNYNVGIEYITTTDRTKEDIVRLLLVALENEKIKFPYATIEDRRKTELILEELRHYVIKTTPAGNEKMEASGGFHDDLVDALGFAIKSAQSSGMEPGKLPGDRGSDLEHLMDLNMLPEAEGDFDSYDGPPILTKFY